MNTDKTSPKMFRVAQDRSQNPNQQTSQNPHAAAGRGHVVAGMVADVVTPFGAALHHAPQNQTAGYPPFPPVQVVTTGNNFSNFPNVVQTPATQLGPVNRTYSNHTYQGSSQGSEPKMFHVKKER